MLYACQAWPFYRSRPRDRSESMLNSVREAFCCLYRNDDGFSLSRWSNSILFIRSKGPTRASRMCTALNECTVRTRWSCLMLDIPFLCEDWPTFTFECHAEYIMKNNFRWIWIAMESQIPFSFFECWPFPVALRSLQWAQQRLSCHSSLHRRMLTEKWFR